MQFKASPSRIVPIWADWVRFPSGGGKFGKEPVKIRFHASGAHRGVQISQALLPAGMPDGVQLKFQGEEHARPVFHHFAQMEREPADALFAGRSFAQMQSHLLAIARQILLKNGEEDIFLVLKIRIKSAARFSGRGGDLFHAGKLEAAGGEDPPRGAGQLHPGEDGALLLPGKHRWALRRPNVF